MGFGPTPYRPMMKKSFWLFDKNPGAAAGYSLPATEVKEFSLPRTSRWTTDALFAVQIGFTFIWGGSQFLRLLSSTQGVNISWFMSWLAFLLLNLVLAFRAHYNQPSRVTLQTILSYAAWTAMVVADLGAMLWRGTHVWDRTDSVTALLVAAGLAVILLVAYRINLGLVDPMVKGYLAVAFKAIPQLALAYKIFLMGGRGLSPVAVVTGHITILTRLGQLWYSIKEAGWDRNRRGSALSELANEGSWLVATLAWLVR